MGRKPRTSSPKYYFIPEEVVFEAYAEKHPLRDERELREEHYFPLGDPVLVALREAFSLTYPPRVKEVDSKKQLEQIKLVSTKALRPLGDLLTSLGLAPAGVMEEDREGAVYKTVIIPGEKLPKAVQPEQLLPADPAIIALREVLSLTFSEAYDIKDFTRIFAKIRQVAAKVLVVSNAVLEFIEVEPVAMPRRFNPNEEEGA